jgi:hypothetical protein
MKTFKITEEVLAGILQYLATKPYAEVAQGIQALSGLEEIVEKVGNKASGNLPDKA